jgi:hypothetical protein
MAGLDPTWQRRCRKVFALLKLAHVTEREERLNLFRWILHDPTVTSTNDLSAEELQMVADVLGYWQSLGELESRSRQHTGPIQA